MSSALAARRVAQELKNLRSTDDLIKAQRYATVQGTRESTMREDHTRWQNRILETQYVGALVEAGIDSSAYGKFLRALGRLNPFSSQAPAILRAVK